MATARPSTCPSLPGTGGAPRGGHVDRLRMASESGRSLSRGFAESECPENEDNRANVTRSALGKPCVRVVWGAGRSQD